MKIKVGTRSETFSIYKNEISNKNKLDKMPLSFLTNDAMRQLAACDSEMRKAADYQEKSIAELLQEAYAESAKDKGPVEV